LDVSRVAEALFAGTLAPLVLGGTITPGHAIGARVAHALGAADATSDRDLASRVEAGRLRRARALAPIDAVPEIDDADWALGAALHDVLQSVNPTFDAPQRRYAATRILEIASASIERIPRPARVGDALSRHTWFARVLEVRRTDTAVSFWLGSRQYLGREPPARLSAWPELRRVNVVRARREVLDLSPIAVDRDRLARAISAFLERTPLTDLAGCVRAAPPFAWTEGTLRLLETESGRTLVLRALDRLPRLEVDAALGRATREVLAGALRSSAGSVVKLLAERAIALAAAPALYERADATVDADAQFARAIGAIAARRSLMVETLPAPIHERERLSAALSAAAARAAEAARALDGAD
jgi:hypothetical protein